MEPLDAEERKAWELESFAHAFRVWLADLMDARDHIILFDVLYATPFEAKVPMDRNRVEDAKALRLRFAEEAGLEYRKEYDEWPCSFLEMLVALSCKLEDLVLYDGYLGDRKADWFWMILGNMGLGGCNDAYMMYEPGAEWVVHNAVETVVERRYDASGTGGMFPLRAPMEDQRTVEIWYQAHAYILENDIR